MISYEVLFGAICNKVAESGNPARKDLSIEACRSKQ